MLLAVKLVLIMQGLSSFGSGTLWCRLHVR